jgi:hypothetical protein
MASPAEAFAQTEFLRVGTATDIPAHGLTFK